jgi:sulfatase modifying factor 1
MMKLRALASVMSLSFGVAALAMCTPFKSEPAAPDAGVPDAGDSAVPEGGDLGRPCPSARGPQSIRVVHENGSFCIDESEVTFGQYADFRATADLSLWPPECAFKTAVSTPSAPDDDLPATNVDWCDAWLFCRWAGKRLCGRIGGGPLSSSEARDPTIAEWTLACAGPRKTVYPYADAFDITACAAGLSAIRPVKGSPRCTGGHPGLFDMSGNASEWIDLCEEQDGGSDTCFAKGGGYRYSQADRLSCVPNDGPRDRKAANTDVGIRCCAD